MTSNLKILFLELIVFVSCVLAYCCYDLKHQFVVNAKEIDELEKLIKQEETKSENLRMLETVSLEQTRRDKKNQLAHLDRADKEKEKAKKATEDYNKWKEENTPSMEYMGVYELTAYCSCASCCGWSTGITASGTTVCEGRTVALNGVPFGTVIYIEGLGERVVEDTGGMASNVIDVYHSSHSAALKFGRKKNVTVYKVTYPNRSK